MSESTITTTTTTTPAESNGTPSPAADTVAAVQAATEHAVQTEQEAREHAERTRKAAVDAYRKAESALRNGYLESGRLCDQYLQERMALTDKRAVGVQALEGELARYSSTVVEVNRLIGVYHAYRLLAVEPGLVGTGRKRGPADDVPYGHYRDGYSQLVERVEKDTPREHWILLPGLESECRELFARCTADGLSKGAVQDAVKGLHRV